MFDLQAESCPLNSLLVFDYGEGELFMTFISGIFQSLIANMLFSFFRMERITRKKSDFEARSKLFHSNISPYILDTVIPELSPKINRKLYRCELNAETKTFPFISLESINKVTLPTSLQTARRKFFLNEKLIDWLDRELKRNLTNNPTFTIDGISRDCKLSIGIGDYYSTISTSDVHYFNLIRYFPLKTKRGAFFTYRHGRYMSEWLNSLESIVIDKDFSHYCASIGCSVFTVLKGTDGKYKYLIKKNSSAKGSSAFEHHVIPSFMFQPIARRDSEQERELDLELSVVREFGEELLGVESLENAETVDVLLEQINSNNLLNFLYNNIKSKSIFLEKTGFILDVYRLRPEITFLLIIDDDEYSKNLKTNWETEKNSLDLIELNDDSAYLKLLSAQENALCAPGAAALINGRNRAIEVLNRNIDI